MSFNLNLISQCFTKAGVIFSELCFVWQAGDVAFLRDQGDVLQLKKEKEKLRKDELRFKIISNE